MKRYLVILTALFVFYTIQLNAQKTPKTKVEQVTKICEGLAQADKPIVAVMPFKLAAPGAEQSVGTGLPDMLVNAIFNTGCFRVVERDRLNDIMKEQGMGLSGAGDESSFAQVGKALGAQILIFGTITEFTENESGGGGGGGGLLGRRRGGLALIGGGVGAKTSHIGYTIKVVNPSTGELLDTKSFDKKKTAVGLAGGGLFGGGAAGGLFYKNKSMQDAIEESLIEAVEYMSQNKSAYVGVAQGSNASTNSQPKVTKENCSLLTASRKPKIMVIIPEEHLSGAGSKYDPARTNQVNININTPNNNGMNQYTSTPPSQAGETEISRKFLEFGFDLVDSKQFEKLKGDKSLQDAFESPAAASKIAARFGADIIIVGEAFSEYSKAENGMSSCRARVEVKAVMTKDAKLLATEGFQGSGMDATEIIAGKTALKNAGSKIADYFLAQLCSKSDDIVAAMGSKKSAATSANTTQTNIQFNNVDFNKAMAIGKMIQSVSGVSKAERISFSDNIAKYTVTHTGDTNALMEKIATNKMGIKLNIKTIDGNAADVDVK